MIRFEEEFEVHLQVTEHEFSAYILSIVNSDLNELSEKLASTIKPYRSHIKFNSFKLIPIQSFFKKAYMQIRGKLKSDNGKLLVRGRIVSNKLLLTILIGYIILFFGMLIHSLISAQIEKSIVAAIGMCFLIGLGNLIKLKKSLQNPKTDFLGRLGLLEKERMLHS